MAGPSRSPSPTLSGSSIEEESEDGEVHENAQSAMSRRTVDDTSRELLAAFDDVRLRGADVYPEDEDEDWDVEDEDWELADGGERGIGRRLTLDFTKQYNRLRQQHAAVAVGSGSRQAVPLPARNVHHTRNAPSTKLLAPGTRSGGVAANPKSDNSRPTKDKADRATTEQVLDARTRLVLSGLVNRGVIGKVEHCVSTGKEVRTVSTRLTLGKRIPRSDRTEPPRLARPISRRPRGQDLSHVNSPLQVAPRLHCRRAPIPGRILVLS
jgi:RIO kinase 1